MDIPAVYVSWPAYEAACRGHVHDVTSTVVLLLEYGAGGPFVFDPEAIGRAIVETHASKLRELRPFLLDFFTADDGGVWHPKPMIFRQLLLAETEADPQVPG